MRIARIERSLSESEILEELGAVTVDGLSQHHPENSLRFFSVAHLRVLAFDPSRIPIPWKNDFDRALDTFVGCDCQLVFLDFAGARETDLRA